MIITPFTCNRRWRRCAVTRLAHHWAKSSIAANCGRARRPVTELQLSRLLSSPMTAATQAELTYLIARGEQKRAASLLVRDHAAAVFGLCRAVVRDPRLAEDLSQDAFTLAFSALTRYRTCRNIATLKFWHRANAELARLPPADQAAARTQKAAVLARELDAGITSCASSCVSANNTVQTACMANATSVEQLATCE